MIPKKIHYCWFGRNPKPKLAQKCIKSWKRFCPDYQIVEWNEDNYDLSQAPLYVRQAYEARKWAFVTDYVRLQVVYEHGGIYLDTDGELKKKPDDLLKHQAYFGFERGEYIATGLGFGAVEGCPILKEMMSDYENIPFVLEDGSYDLAACPVRNTEVFLRYGLKQDNSMQVLDGDVLILPSEYLSPIDNGSCTKTITDNTVSVHWFASSWCSEEERREFKNYQKMMHRIHLQTKVLETTCRFAKRILGNCLYEHIRDFLKGVIRFLKR